jgi:hypothetical protein
MSSAYDSAAPGPAAVASSDATMIGLDLRRKAASCDGGARQITESDRSGVNSYIVEPVNFERFAAAVKVSVMYSLLLNQPPRIGQ